MQRHTLRYRCEKHAMMLTETISGNNAKFVCGACDTTLKVNLKKLLVIPSKGHSFHSVAEVGITE